MNNENWKSIWQNTLNKCFDDGELKLIFDRKYYKLKCYVLILVKQEDKKGIIIMNTPAGRLMKCFLRDIYMVVLLYFIYPFKIDELMLFLKCHCLFNSNFYF